MHVGIDEAGHDQLVGGIDHLKVLKGGGACRKITAFAYYPVTVDQHIAAREAVRAGFLVDDEAVLDQDCHALLRLAAACGQAA